MKQFTLKSLLLVLTILMGGVNAWGETGSLTFGTNNTKINSPSVTASDNLGNSWTITTVGTTSFTQQPTYSQVGSKGNPATSITFATTLPSAVNITSFSVKFGGFSGTAGTISLKVDNTEIGTGSLNAANDVTVENNTSASGNVLTISVTGISKGVKVYNLSYTYESAGSGPSAPTFSLAEGTYWKEQILELTTTIENGIIYYTIDGNDPTETSDVYSAPIKISETTTVKAFVKDANGNSSAVAARTYTFVPSIANTKETAYTTDEAIELIKNTSAEQLADEKVYVKGVVSKVDSYNSGSITYWLDDNAFEVYSGKGLDNTDFTSKDGIKFGAEVIVYGNIKKFNSTYEFDKNNYLVFYEEHTIELNSIEISGTPNTTAYEENASFSCSGLVVTANYNDDSTQDVTGNVTWSVDPEILTAGTTQVIVTATYEGKSDSKTFDVTVIIPQPVEANSIIVAEYVKDGVTKHAAMTTKLNDTYLSSTEIIKAGDKYIVTGEVSDILFRTETIDGQTTIQNIADGKYLQATAAKNISFTVLPYSWTNDGEMLTAANSKYGTLQFNTSSPRFTTYGSKVGQYATIVDMSNVVSGAVLTLLAKDGTANYATFSSDRDVEFVDATVYAVNVVNGVLQLNEVTSKQVPKGTGVLLKSEKETAPYFYINEAATIDNNLNLLKPASEEMTGTYTFYKLAYDDYDAKTGLGFYWGAENGGVFTVKAGTAYLAVPNAVSVKGFLLDGTPTAIEGVEAENNTDVIYNLSGQRVQKAQRGLYIVNGKKFMVK